MEANDACFIHDLRAVAVRHSLRVLTAAWWGPFFGVPTSTQTMRPCPTFSDQKSTPSTPLIFCLSSIPSGMTSPWQNQADFWCTWSFVSFGSPSSIGHARVTGMSAGRVHRPEVRFGDLVADVITADQRLAD